MNDSSKNENQINKEFPEPVYFVSSDKDDTVLVAMDVAISDGYVRWFDTVKERTMKIGEILRDDSQAFIFVRSDYPESPSYEFRPMTLELYRDKVKSKLIAGKDFSNEADMIDGFKKTIESAW